MSSRALERLGRPPKVSPHKPAFLRAGIELSGHIAHFGVERVAAVLRVSAADLEPMLAGRVAPPTHKLRQLRALVRELGE